MKKILITGGTGFFGVSLLRYWMNQYELGKNKDNNFEICILSRNPKIFLDKYPEFNKIKWIKFKKGDILKPSSFPRNKNFTHILHAAADSTLGTQIKNIDRFNQIFEGTKNILKYATQNNITRLLYISSGGVYGSQPNNIDSFDENYKKIHIKIKYFQRYKTF
jgi:dTDP-glucose 4,6-dehydratase